MIGRLLLIATLALGACATVPPGAQNETDAGRATRTVPPTASYQGRFSLGYVDQTQSERHVYGNFAWRETGDAVRVELRNPFGSTLAVIDSDEAGATLTLPNREPQRAADVEGLMQRALGFALPVSGLRYWLAAQPAPGTAPSGVRRDAQGRLSHLDQDGWSIDYLGYAEPTASGDAARAGANGPAQAAAPGAAAVTRMNLERDGASGKPLDVRLVIDPPA
ncbi:lipoprotein insertase outer membrane protein LolB [Chitinasiproducens palmae]|uniref:Outer-membrane lipoprotein LolB n=1 Tax=Chitinasiproducens palmae TaxID=1770053 RepID=A0A1H2PNF3_9BURK|nr:lipoprotein insertase outer membrane protein LolB [Chitinasiproducens palmae]SDV48214.1 outer membrane lipoprotein LolB [Chitinasiproducens palmae]